MRRVRRLQCHRGISTSEPDDDDAKRQATRGNCRYDAMYCSFIVHTTRRDVRYTRRTQPNGDDEQMIRRSRRVGVLDAMGISIVSPFNIWILWSIYRIPYQCMDGYLSKNEEGAQSETLCRAARGAGRKWDAFPTEICVCLWNSPLVKRPPRPPAVTHSTRLRWVSRFPSSSSASLPPASTPRIGSEGLKSLPEDCSSCYFLGFTPDSRLFSLPPQPDSPPTLSPLCCLPRSALSIFSQPRSSPPRLTP